jgi:hypothetical protein
MIRTPGLKPLKRHHGHRHGKNTFHLVGLDKRGAIVRRERLSRAQIEAPLANMLTCLVGMESCVRATSSPAALRFLIATFQAEMRAKFGLSTSHPLKNREGASSCRGQSSASTIMSPL